MNFVKQPYKSKQCGQACLAMVTGKSLKEVCKELQNYWGSNIVEELPLFLENNGFKTVLSEEKLIRFEDVPNNSILRHWTFKGEGHFIVKHNGKYYDPSIGIIEKYYPHVEKNVNYYLTFEKL